MCRTSIARLHECTRPSIGQRASAVAGDHRATGTASKKPMKPSIKLRGAYALIVLLSFAILVYRMCTVRSEAYQAGVMKNRAEYVTAYPLKLNHRLRDKDFEAPDGIPGALAIHLPDPKDLIGAYLRQERKKGQPISKKMVHLQPLIELQGGKEIRVVPLAEQAHALQWLDAGMDVQVGTAKEKKQGSVVAVTCPQPEDSKTFDGKTCAALIALPPQPEIDSTKWRLEPGTKSDPKQQGSTVPDPKVQHPGNKPPTASQK
jgi:hypothetical protein